MGKIIEERDICYERMRDYSKNLELHVKLLLQDIEPEAYENIYRIVENHPQFKTQIDLKELDALLVKFSSEDKAIKFKKAASETDLDQRNDFLNLYLTLLPKNSSYLYEANIDKADAEVFRYRLCFDKAFREEIKQKERLTEKELNINTILKHYQN